MIAAINMNTEGYKTKRQGQPKRESPLSRSKFSMLKNAEVANTYSSPRLREIYLTKTAWAARVIPKIKEK